MKRILIISIILSLLFLCSCKNESKFVSTSDSGLSDGVHTYRYLPDGWHYYGSINVYVGKTSNAVKVYSDNSGLFIRKQNKPFSMNNAPLMREDFDLLTVLGAESIVIAAGKGDSPKRLSAEAKQSFLLLYEFTLRQPNKSDGRINEGYSDSADIYFEFSTIDGLRYEPGLQLVHREDDIILVDPSGNFYKINETSPLYGWIEDSNLWG